MPHPDEAHETPEPATMSVQEAVALVDGMLRFHRGLDSLSKILHLAVEIEAETLHKQARLQEVTIRLGEAEAKAKAVNVQVAEMTKRRDALRVEIEKLKASIGAL